MPIVPPHPARAQPQRPPAGLALLGALALLAAGCGSSHLVKVDSSVLRLRIDEYSITPQDVQVHAGRLKIIVFNSGIAPHDVRLETQGGNRAAAVLGGTSVLLPGQQAISCAIPATPTNTCPKLDLQPGTYRLFDTIANHADLGDYGTLTVVP